MNQCFLFIETFDTDGCVGLCLNADGDVVVPLQKHSIDAIATMQLQAKTCVVVPSTKASIHWLDLPWLGERKSREAIPFALEDLLAEPVSALHVAFSKHHYYRGHYLVVVIAKQQCLDWMSALLAHGLVCDHMTLDWFALNPDEICVTQTGLLVYNDVFRGGMTPALASRYFNQDQVDPIVRIQFADSCLQLVDSDTTVRDGSVRTWIAQRLLKARYIDLCQGSLGSLKPRELGVRWYTVLGGLIGLLWLIFVGMQVLRAVQLERVTKRMNQQTAVLYHAFFPEETRVLNPKFRVEQWLQTNASAHQRVFWFLFNSLSKTSVKFPEIILEQVTFQEKRLSVKLTCGDFAGLEAFEGQLKDTRVTVNQKSAASENNQVVAVLELTE